MQHSSRLVAGSLCLGLALLLSACGKPGAESPAPQTSVPAAVKPADPEHGHKTSQHGGLIVSIGSDSYHAEAVFEKGGVLRLYMLGKDESRILEVEAQPLTAFVKAEGDAEAEAVALLADPTPEDATGKTSRFIARLPAALAGRKLEVTIPSIRVGGERFRLAFESVVKKDAVHDSMPVGVSGDEERKLYLTPGGRYSENDIKANGSVTATQKFRGIRAEHDMNPKVGDRICPVTMTKANPKFGWVVAGKTYAFCCPPCIDEFVQQAKDRPDELKDPEFYRKK